MAYTTVYVALWRFYIESFYCVYFRQAFLPPSVKHRLYTFPVSISFTRFIMKPLDWGKLKYCWHRRVFCKSSFNELLVVLKTNFSKRQRIAITSIHKKVKRSISRHRHVLSSKFTHRILSYCKHTSFFVVNSVHNENIHSISTFYRLGLRLYPGFGFQYFR